MTTDTFTKAEIAQAINRPPRTIQFWTDKGVIVPDVRGPEGKGVSRLYSKENLTEFKMVDILSGEYGLQLYLIRLLFDYIRGGIAPISRVDFFRSTKKNDTRTLIAIIENAPKFDEDRYYWERHEPLSVSFCFSNKGIVQLSTGALSRGALTVVDLTTVRDLASKLGR